MSEHDAQMPKGWHTIKSVLLTELATASTFALCCEAADALFHARLIGESISREMRDHFPGSGARGAACAAGLPGDTKP